MGFWDERVVPQMVRWACAHENVNRQRAKVVPHAHGRVLEIGMGAGLNVPHYDPDRVTEVVGIEPSARLRSDASRRAAAAPMPVRVVDAVAERLPVDDESIDSAVVTYTLCTIPDVGAALRELRRVLVPGGTIHFVEHGLAPDERVRRLQRVLEPGWRRFAGGCHLTRDVARLLAQHGFAVEELDAMYLPGPRVLNWNRWGRARSD